MQPLLQHGAGIKLVINDVIIGFATGLNFTRSNGSKFIYGIDSPLPQEIAKTTYACQGQLTGFRVRDSGGLDGYGIMNESTMDAFFNFKYATIQVIDRKTNKIIYSIQKVVFDSDSWNMQAKTLITFSATFKGIFVSNEVSDQS